MGEYRHIEHPFPPLYDDKAKVLILGSFPSAKSREQRFFYGHPQNRFWKVMAAVFSDSVPSDIPEKREFLLSHGVAVWDVIQSCDIIGSSDSSIRNALPTDLRAIFEHSQVSHVFANGKTAGKLYDRFQYPVTGIPALVLPSTSPANAAYSLEKLTEEWQLVRKTMESGENG